MDDSHIISLFLERNEDAILVTARKYGNGIRQLAFQIVQNQETAEECENDTYHEAWRRIPPHEPRDYLYRFLLKLTRNIALNRCIELSRLKRKAFICELSDELSQCIPDKDTPESHLDQMELTRCINTFLHCLDDLKRNLFIRRYWYLDSIKSLSQRFHLSESNVKTTLLRCRNKLRECLEKEDIFL